MDRLLRTAALVVLIAAGADGLPDERVVEAMRHRTPQRPY